MMASPITVSDVLAGLALILSAYSTWKTVRFNERQKSLLDGQEALNRRLLEREEAEANESKRAILGVEFFKVGSSNYRLKVYNKGKSAARDVRIEFPEGNEVFLASDIQDKFPLKELERHQSVELMAAFHMGSKATHPLRLRWADDAQAENEKMFYPVR
jgi:hypothetical protein